MNDSKSKRPNALAEELEGILIRKKFVEQLTPHERRLILESKSGIVARHFDPLRAQLKGEIAIAEQDDPSRASATATVHTRIVDILERGIIGSKNLSTNKAVEAKQKHKKSIEDLLRPAISKLIRSKPSIKSAAIVRELLRKDPYGNPVHAWVKTQKGEAYKSSGLRPYVQRLADEIRRSMER